MEVYFRDSWPRQLINGTAVIYSRNVATAAVAMFLDLYTVILSTHSSELSCLSKERTDFGNAPYLGHDKLLTPWL